MRSRLLCSFLVAALCGPPAARAQWGAPVPITRGAGDDLHQCAMMNADAFSFPQPREWLAFSRNGNRIMVTTTDTMGTAWLDSVWTVTPDSGENDFPSLAHRFSPAGGPLFLAWQGRRNGNLEILVAEGTGRTWSVPTVHFPDTAADVTPSLFAERNAVSLAWERSGTIMHAERADSGWRPPETVATRPDSAGDSNPVVLRVWSSTWGITPVVVWKRTLRGTGTIMYSSRQGGVWTAPRTLSAGLDVSPPRAVTGIQRLQAVSWDMAGTIDRVVWYSTAYDSSGSIRCSAPEALSFLGPPISGSRTHINAYTVPIREQTARTIAPALAAWEPSPPRGDSLGVMNSWDQQVKYLSAGPASRNIEPAITTGRFSYTPAGLRMWVTWRSDATGSWKLYGSFRLIMFNGIESGERPPASAALLQNFPNPFNPRTIIRFSIQSETWVQLEVCDLLGRTVSTLVNGRLPAGVHSVPFDGSGLASGVYLYRLEGDGLTEVRKMLLAR